MDNAFKVKEDNASQLLQKKNVVAVGVGQKITDGKQTGEESILVFVEKKKDPSDLSAMDLVPDEINGVKTDVIEVGKLVAMNFKGKHRPLVGGISAIHYHGSACTLGAIVYKNGKTYALQNAHCGFPHWEGAKKGDPIIQQSPMDGGLQTDVIGYADDVEMIRFDGSPNQMDACLVELTVDAKPLTQFGNPVSMKKDIQNVSVGETVVKSGRTTGYQEAKVIAVNVTAFVSYDEKVAVYHNQVFTENEGGRFISGGDSSSLVLNKSGNPVALVFAGSNRIGIITPIQRVVDRFKFTFEPVEAPTLEGYVALTKIGNKRPYVEIDPISAKKGNYGDFDYNINMRKSASTNGEKIVTLPAGTKFDLLEDPVEREGYIWGKIRVRK